MILRYLFDTCVISELVKPSPSTSVVSWVDAQEADDLFLSVITMGEIRKGIEAARPKNLAAALRYEKWLEVLTGQYAGRILSFDETSAQIWGTLMARNPNSDVEDAQIAAIALAYEMVVVTRNVAHFAPLGVPVHNPF
jgi:predicted nucleic acid-binding protein